MRIELLQGVDFAQDIGMDPAIVIDVEMSDSQIGRKVVIDELAAEAGLRNERQPPAAALIVIDRPRHIGGDRLLAKGIERHQEIHRNVADLKRPRDFNGIIPTLRMSYEDITLNSGFPVNREFE